jgi:hypothetical protein
VVNGTEMEKTVRGSTEQYQHTGGQSSVIHVSGDP